ncbi:beta-ketoacyl [Dorcoceras hygrometricum]|uniref:beta-ketoacyl-[acyl-carrier-protein] synthase I n=1 Tax=Dorcoceras hygrometricum TaxID=472368 RepID=A0A2Z7BCG0_9LAMI|nr:beta-ketoacyl [Dorcoceras hygrometricum]
MASINAFASSSGLICKKSQESSRRSGNGVSFFQYNGLRAAETLEMGLNKLEAKGFTTSATRGRVKAAVTSPTTSAPKRETDPKKRIVITGMGLVSVFGSDIDTFYNKLLEGTSGISQIDRFDPSEYAVRFAGQIRDFSSTGYIDGKNDRRLDDCWRYCLVAGKKALDDANLGTQVVETMDKTRIGVLVGSGMGGISAFSSGVESLVLKGHKKIMESLDHAMKRGAKIIAEYLGGAVTCDAHHMTDPRKDGLGVSSCIIKSLQDAGVAPEEVNYVNAHATSTLAGDLAEVSAIKKVFKDTSEIKMNGTKSMIGHGLGAAGGLEAIVTIQAINTGWLHPTINQHDLEPEVTIDTVPNVKKQHEVNVAISNSFGFGGHNSVVVFAPFKP